MYTHDDSRTARIFERIVAAIFGCIFGLVLGAVLAFVLRGLFGFGPWVAGLPIIIFSVYGFVSPNNSRDFLTRSLNSILDYLLKR